jgi:SAM-dependent methyltransferase
MNKDLHNTAYGQSKLSIIDLLTIRGRIKISSRFISDYQMQHKNLNNETITVLELGCGYRGLNLVHLSKAFPDIYFTGVDVSVNSINNPHVNLLQGNIDLWQPQNNFDIVLSLAVVEHLIDPVKHFELIRQCLKPGGIAILTTPTPPNHFVWGTLARLGIIDVENVDEHKLYLTHGGIYGIAKSHNMRVIDYKQFQLGLNQYAVLNVQVSH